MLWEPIFDKSRPIINNRDNAEDPSVFPFTDSLSWLISSGTNQKWRTYSKNKGEHFKWLDEWQSDYGQKLNDSFFFTFSVCFNKSHDQIKWKKGNQLSYDWFCEWKMVEKIKNRLCWLLIGIFQANESFFSLAKNRIEPSIDWRWIERSCERFQNSSNNHFCYEFYAAIHIKHAFALRKFCL